MLNQNTGLPPCHSTSVTVHQIQYANSQKNFANAATRAEVGSIIGGLVELTWSSHLER